MVTAGFQASLAALGLVLLERRFLHKSQEAPAGRSSPAQVPRPSAGNTPRQSTAGSRRYSRAHGTPQLSLELGVLLDTSYSAGHRRSPRSVCPHAPFRPPAEERAHWGAHSHRSLQAGGARIPPCLEQETSPGPLGRAGGARAAPGGRAAQPWPGGGRL